jgi:Co/Zn/Cd efflux system component
MSDGHDHATTFEGLSDEYRRRLILVTAINIGMFVVEMVAGHLSGSKALQADALDFAADGATYALSFWAIGKPLAVRAGAAFVKGLSLLAIGLWVGATTLYQFFVLGVPQAEVMSVIGILALAANLFSVWMLMPYKDGDANVRSVWLCSRNDAIGNVAVVIAAVFVVILNNGVPDLIVAGVMSALFLSSASQILVSSYKEWQHAKVHPTHGFDHTGDHKDHDRRS